MWPVGRRDLFCPPTTVTDEMLRLTSRDGPWRVVADGYGYYPSSLAMHRLDDIRHHNPLAPMAYARILGTAFEFHEKHEYFSAFHASGHPLLDFLNVRVVAVRGHGRLPDGLLPLQSPSAAVRLARNPGVLRRFFVAPSVEVVPRDGVMAAVDALADARRVVVAAEDLDGWLPTERPWRPRAVRVARLDQGDVELALPHRSEKLLATSLTFPEGWEVTAGGKALKTLTVNGAFLGAVVPDGVGEVRLRFVPNGLRPGVLIGIVACALLAALALIPPQERRAPTAGPELGSSRNRMD